MSWQQKSSTPPPGYAYGPAYQPSRETMLRGVVYIARGQQRSLAHDALYALANMPQVPLVCGSERIPKEGPLVLVANHYERPGLWMAWPALLVSHLVQERTGRDTHWVAIGEWESFSLFGVPIPPGIIRRVFTRAFGTYGIIAMPPPRAPLAARASAMRTTARQVREGGIVGIMPEGDVGTTPELLPAREGVGTFLQMLGAPILPVGLSEKNGHLVAQFGNVLALDVPGGLSRDESDRWVRERAMIAIRDLLPEPLWGAYRDVSLD